jgi:hypothetical protein
VGETLIVLGRLVTHLRDQPARQRMTFGHHNRVALSDRNSHQNCDSGLVFPHLRVWQRELVNGKRRVSMPTNGCFAPIVLKKSFLADD